MLKFIIDSKDDVPEALVDHYEEKEGKWHLKVEGGMVPATKVAEFRDNNIELKGKLEKFEPLEGKVDEALEAMKTVKALDEKKLIDAGKVDEVVAERVKELNEQHATQVGTLETQLSETKGQLSKHVIEGQLLTVGNELGLKSTAAADLVARGSAVFTLKDGQPVAMDGDKPLYESDGITPLSPKTWVEGLTKTAVHLFEESAGGGGGSQKGGSNAEYNRLAAKNPWSDDHRNLTQQGLLATRNPALAKKLAAAAGVDLNIDGARPLSAPNTGE